MTLAGVAPAAVVPRPLVGLIGAGAVGSRLARHVPAGIALAVVDRDLVMPENLGIAAFDAPAVGRRKAAVVAAAHRHRGGRAMALAGEIVDVLGHGLVAALDAAVLCLDNPAALRDAADALWTAAPAGLPVLAVTCGGRADEQWQVRIFAVGGVCPVCLMGAGERAAGTATSCAAADAPRAAAEAAEAAARVGGALLGRALGGEDGLAGLRLQRDGRGWPVRSARLPRDPVAGCPLDHGGGGRTAVVDLEGTIDELTVGALAARAREAAGSGAAILLGRRGLPLAGLRCPTCGRHSAAPPLLAAAARAAARACACPTALRALGQRSRIPVAELAAPAMAAPTLRAWGAAPGDAFLAVGGRGTVELRCRLAWQEKADG